MGASRLHDPEGNPIELWAPRGRDIGRVTPRNPPGAPLYNLRLS